MRPGELISVSVGEIENVNVGELVTCVVFARNNSNEETELTVLGEVGLVGHQAAIERREKTIALGPHENTQLRFTHRVKTADTHWFKASGPEDVSACRLFSPTTPLSLYVSSSFAFIRGALFAQFFVFLKNISSQALTVEEIHFDPAADMEDCERQGPTGDWQSTTPILPGETQKKVFATKKTDEKINTTRIEWTSHCGRKGVLHTKKPFPSPDKIETHMFSADVLSVCCLGNSATPQITSNCPFAISCRVYNNTGDETPRGRFIQENSATMPHGYLWTDIPQIPAQSFVDVSTEKIIAKKGVCRIDGFSVKLGTKTEKIPLFIDVLVL
ncbi:MAG: uncharacterized protein A8A55_0433 [Amphiamblys sp. WSBS2006]|nr:MAG: uncharacterized protein A8A55_0433 [Amphiamblys sp. WSBS2006]